MVRSGLSFIKVVNSFLQHVSFACPCETYFGRLDRIKQLGLLVIQGPEATEQANKALKCSYCLAAAMVLKE